ncbi:MAG: response regulator [Oscillospiraceae bacterium]|nr:response regulator [Oscillospiraceae bacterium]
MKYKILLNGRNGGLVSDFIQHTDAFFDTLSTSECWQDIVGHFKVFNPDAYVCFVEREYERTVNTINRLKEDSDYNGAAVFIISDSDTCNSIEATSRYTANVLIRRPVTPDNLVLRITRYFDELNEAKERAEARVAAKKAEEAAKQAALEAEAAKIAASGEKKHILIVDDDRNVLKLVKAGLGDKYEITAMINGVMVDKLIDTKKVDLIILDYEMPIETGADIFRRLKKNPKAAHIPVCFLTGVSEREKILEVMSLKPHSYLLKPIDMDMLASTIVNLTE